MFHKITPQNRVALLKALFIATIAQSLIFTACSQEDNAVVPPIPNTQNSTDVYKDNAGNNPNTVVEIPPSSQINIDSLAEVIKNEIANSFKDSLLSGLDGNENIEFKDSLNTPQTGITENSTSIIRNLDAVDAGTEDIYGAFANHYALMYDNFTFINDNRDTITIQSPFPIVITNTCKEITPCSSQKIMVKTWIPGFTDTATITGIVFPTDSIILSPNLNFNDNALQSLTSAKKVNREIEVYVLEKDNQLLFHSESKPTTIHPMQVFGSLEPAIMFDPIYQSYWYSVWVTPMADSIARIVNEVAQKLPNKQLKVYQQYYTNESIRESSIRVVIAVFEVLQSRNIKYVENDGAGSFGQRINYPVETLRKKQGLCIETAVLFASVLERLGFRTCLAIIPGHAFVGWLAEQDSETIDFIETTFIGDKNATAASAILYGIEEYNEQVELGNFESGKSLIVPIEVARFLGITPNNIP
ncbi:hypothetical protein [Fibrobacter sp.]|uniref:hypothetical protein n=1 Tax=Fibrobacter sp. TaxID=35828 RepID=UPI0025F89E75|nr:hypothetical protein [Fibrobacter sp.]MDD5942439.1 hypothetical protein [Fibrobacter sp.]